MVGELGIFGTKNDGQTLGQTLNAVDNDPFERIPVNSIVFK